MGPDFRAWSAELAASYTFELPCAAVLTQCKWHSAVHGAWVSSAISKSQNSLAGTQTVKPKPNRYRDANHEIPGSTRAPVSAWFGIPTEISWYC